ncbi:sce7726 family protein [Rhodococcus sp. (in: high G+C Gram-positive bacteria)]|uniref:sce7726 family protein n=1 Tax=Rhodococcus sp. TaxID=1831 RepID=UPI003260FEEE
MPAATDRIIRKLIDDEVIPNCATRQQAIEHLDKFLAAEYRLEHVYKSAIASKLYLSRHSASGKSRHCLKEFTIGSSCLDAMIVNGKATGYEIKTEFDSFAKLPKQLADYYKALRFVNVVVDEAVSERYSDQLRNSPAGVIAMTRRGALSVRKPAIETTSDLDVETMMKSLRKPEYTEIIRSHFGEVPSVTQVQFFKECLSLSLTIDPILYNRYYEATLRNRRLVFPEGLRSMQCATLKARIHPGKPK